MSIQVPFGCSILAWTDYPTVWSGRLKPSSNNPCLANPESMWCFAIQGVNCTFFHDPEVEPENQDMQGKRFVQTKNIGCNDP